MKTATEIKNDLSRIADVKKDALSERFGALNRENTAERKALHICLNMLGICSAFPRYEFGGHFTEVAYNRVFVDAHYFDSCSGIYEKMSPDEKERFLRYAFPVTMLHRAFLERRAAKLAEPDITAGDAFESKLIVSVIEDVLSDWRLYAAAEALPGTEAGA